MALNEVVAEPWNRLQLQHRHALTMACLCPLGSLNIYFLSVLREFQVRLSTAVCRKKMKVGPGGGGGGLKPAAPRSELRTGHWAL